MFDQINHVRLFKHAIIPAEIIGARGLKTTECYNEIKNKSMSK